MGKKHNRQRVNAQYHTHKAYETLTDDEKTNELFVKYYKRQCIVPEGEWDEFMASLLRDLPQSWRFVGGKKYVAVRLVG